MKSRKFSTQIRTEMIITDLELQKYQTQVRFVLIFLVEYVLASIPRAKKKQQKTISKLSERIFVRQNKNPEPRISADDTLINELLPHF